MKTVKFLFVLLFILSTPLQLFGRVTESAENLLRIIHKVNRHWQENNSPQVRSFLGQCCLSHGQYGGL